jgi:CSLREA domain-containing protein
LLLALIVFLVSPGPRSASAASGQSGPRIWLQEPHGLQVLHKGQPALTEALASGQAEPVALVPGDFDEDGVADLAVGYATAKGGILVVHPGNLDAFAPQSQQSWQAIAAGNFPPAFRDTATVSALASRPDFLAAGNLLGNGHIDLLIATRGSSTVQVLAGDGHGGFGQPRSVPLPGKVTALASQGFGPHSPFAQVFIGIQAPQHASLLVYSGSPKGLTLKSSFTVPASPTSIALGDVDGDGLPDATIIAGGQLLVLHSVSKSASGLETLPLQAAASSIALGRFVFDRDPRLQIAVLLQDGSVQIVAHSGIDSRFWTADELHALQIHRTLRNPLRRVPAAEGWTVVESLSAVAPFTNNAQPPLLLSLRISGHAEDDVVALNREASQLTVVSHPNTRAGDLSFRPAERSIRPYDSGSPVAVTAMRVNADGRKGMVVLHQGQVSPSVMEPLPDPTFVVNTTADTVDVNPGDGRCADAQGNCSLRAAIMEANAEPGVDTIVVPAGTFTLTIPGIDEDSAATGDLDITDGVNIVGAGSNLTIIQAGANASNGIDKVFSINPNGASPSFDTLLSNLTIQFGVNTSAISPFGGAFDWDAGTSGTGNITITSCNISNNSISSSTFGFADGGGGLFSNIVGGTTGTVTISNSTIQNNTAQDTGGGIWVGSTVPLSISNTHVLNNQAVGSGAQQGGGILVFGPSGASQSAIHASTISGNKAGAQGGGIYTTEGLLIDQGTVISNNLSTGDGGGLWSNVTNETTTVSKSTIASNSASGFGGGVEVDSNTIGNNFSMSFTRIAGNAAATGSGLNNAGGSVTATDNWWGCNAGPGAAPCDLTSGTLTASPWIVLSHTANPGTIANGGTSTLTASFLQDSLGGTISAGNLGALIGLPITFGNAVGGTISNAQATIQPTGTATATFTATAGGSAHADATVDHATVTANLMVSSFTITITPSSQTLLAGNSTTYTVTVAPVNGFSGTVTLSLSGCPASTTCSLSSTSIPGASGTSTLTVNTTTSTSAANSTLTVTGSSGTTNQSATATLSVQDYAMVVTPPTQNVDVGSSVAYTITVSRLNGFTGTVTLGVTGLPAGANATFNPTSIGGRVTSSTMTVSTTSATPATNSTLTISGSSGGQSRTTTAILSVKDFQVTLSPASQTVVAGGAVTYTLTVTPVNGFTGSVTPSVSGLPTGANGNFSPSPIVISSGAATSTLTVTTSSSTPAATSTLTIGASIAPLSHSTTATLIVQDFSVTSTTPACIIAGSSATVTVTLTPLNGFSGSANLSVSGLPTGANGSFSPNPVTISGTVTSTLTINTTAATPGGNYTITITAVSGGVTHIVTFVLCVENFTISVSPSTQNVNAGANATYTVTVTPVNGFTGVVTLGQNGLPAGTTFSFSPSSVTITSTSGAQTSALAVGTSNSLSGAGYPFTVSGNIGNLTQTASATLNVLNFTLSVSPSSQTILVGASASYTVTATPVNGFTGTLSCVITGLPANTSNSCPSITITATSGAVQATVVVTSTANTPAQNTVPTITYTNTGGAPSHSVNVNFNTQDFQCTVSPASQPVIAGSSVNYTITVAPLNGFSSPVTFSSGTLPTGVTVTFNPNPLNGGSGTSTMMASTTTSAALANDQLPTNCTSGPITHSISPTLQVQAITTLRPTTFGSNLGIYQNQANAMDGNLSTFSSPLGFTSISEGYWYAFPAFTGTPIAINLKINSAAVVGSTQSDFASANYSLDGLGFTDPSKTWTGIYSIGFGVPQTRSQRTDTVALPLSTDLTKLMVDGTVCCTAPPTDNQQIYDIWVEVTHQ